MSNRSSIKGIDFIGFGGSANTTDFGSSIKYGVENPIGLSSGVGIKEVGFLTVIIAYSRTC